MKLKQLPEDFKVEELNEIKISKDTDKYKIYSLTKKSIETFYLIGYLSKKNDIPFSNFGIAGLKDKHALTKQYFTIPSRYEIKTLKENNFKIEFLGYTDKAIELGDLKGNKFEITARDIKKGELDGIYKKAESLKYQGIPNYFDSQRFGSVSNKEFIAKHIIKKDYESAVKIFLTRYTKFEKSNLKREKRIILENWSNLSKIRLNNKALSKIVYEYIKTKDWLSAYKKIPQNLREIFVSAYQSYLWNECVKSLLIGKVDKKKLYSIKYNIGSLMYYKDISKAELEDIQKRFSSISDNMQLSDTEERIISKVLSKEGLSTKDFDIRKTTGNFFKTHEREVIVIPSDFNISKHEIDELNDRGKNNRFKITVYFTLPKGSYATIVTKRIFNQ